VSQELHGPCSILGLEVGKSLPHPQLSELFRSAPLNCVASWKRAHLVLSVGCKSSGEGALQTQKGGDHLCSPGNK
jgi:hypothetical protein